MEKVKHLDTTHRDTNIQAKINNMMRQHERDTGVRGSPQTRGYVHQTVASCDIYLIKKVTNQQRHRCHTFFQILHMDSLT